MVIAPFKQRPRDPITKTNQEQETSIDSNSNLPMLFNSKLSIPGSANAIVGRTQPIKITNQHYVNGHPLQPPFPQELEQAIFGLGCFWGAERIFWQQPGVYTTAVGYAGGITENPTYREVCSGMTGHTEAVLVVYDPSTIRYLDLVSIFFESHDPTQGMRQGNDRGTQYRSAIYTSSETQTDIANQVLNQYQSQLNKAGHGQITTEIKSEQTFYYAEDDHQQYLAKNPNGYCGLGGTGIRCQIQSSH